MLKPTIAYLLRPQVTTAFDLSVAAIDATSGLVAGQDLERFSKFLSVASGVPCFDLEHGGKLYQKCRIAGAPSNDSLPISFEAVTILAETDSDPNASYP